MLQPISSLRKVPIKKMMNQIYTGWLFQMLKCSPEQHTQFSSFSFFFFSFFQIQKDWTVHWLGLVHTEQVIHMWKHCIYLSGSLCVNSSVTLLSSKEQKPDPVVRYLG